MLRPLRGLGLHWAGAVIVQCDKCATKFRISEEKVTERGVKVRCSRCAHIFVARRSVPAVMAAAVGRPSESETGRLDPVHMTGRLDPASVVDRLQSTSLSPPAAAKSEQAALALGFTRRTPIPNLSGDFEAVTAQMDFPPHPGLGPEALPRSTELRSFDLPTPDLPEEGPGAHRPPGEAVSTALSSEGLAITRFNPAAGSGALRAPASPSDLEPISDPASDRASERVSEWLATELIPEAQSGTAPGTAEMPRPVAVGPDRPRTNTLNLESFPSPAEMPRPVAVGPDRPRTDTLNLESFPSPAEMPRPVAVGPDRPRTNTLNLESFPSPTAGLPPSAPGRSGDIPGLLPPGSLTDDPFENLELLDAEPELPADGAYAHFDPVPDDLSEPGPEPPPPDRGPHEPLARIALGGPEADDDSGFSNAPLTTVAPAYRREGRTEAAGDPRGLWPSAFGAVIGLVGVLLGFPEVGRSLLEPFAPEPILAALGYRVPVDAVRGVRVVDPQAAPYRAADGRTLLVVAGRARNETSAPIDALNAVVRVQVEERVVAQAEVLVGVTLRPRALYRVVDRETLDRAWAQARAEAAPRPLSPGDERPFMAVFYDAAPAEGPRRVDVEFHSPAAGTLSSSGAPEKPE